MKAETILFSKSRINMMGPTEPLANGVIAYNGDSERGWNDPPTLSFAAVVAKGPKLDLRKRVSHQEALTGRREITSPLNHNPPNLYKQPGNNLSNGLSNLALGQQQPFQQVVPNVPPISPCHSRHSSGTYTPPLLPDTRGVAMGPLQYPVQSYPSDQNNTPSLPSYSNLMPPTTNIPNTNASHASSTAVTPTAVPPTVTTGPPKIFSPVETTIQSDTAIIHPLTQKLSNTLPVKRPPITTAPPSNLGKPLFSFPGSFNMVPISSALDTSHVRSNPDISPDTQTLGNVAATQIPSFPNTNINTQGPLIFTPSPTSADSVTPVSTIGKRSPILSRAFQNGNGPKIYTPSPPTINGSGRNSPVVSQTPPVAMNRSPTSTPPSGRSASTTPRSTTPDNGYRSDTSRHNSEEFDSQEGMDVTVEAIEEIILKCSNILKAREVEDVKKKVAIMKQLWIDGNLSVPVQMSMKLLTEALLDGDTDTAHKVHIKLMVDHVGEVKQWMVAIKRLISAVVNINNTVS